MAGGAFFAAFSIAKYDLLTLGKASFSSNFWQTGVQRR
jgi:hypothetical protein